jgi:alpha-tubulin suppressor-like RCC1 family protein
VWGWGSNEKGELATGTFTPFRAIAAPLSGLSGVTSISAGMSHALALTTSGQVRSWGENSIGQVCDGTKVDRATPVQVQGLPAGVVSEVTAGRFSLALRIAGSVYTCGRNISGQLGDGTTTERLTAVAVPGLSNVQQVAVGGSHVVAIRA